MNKPTPVEAAVILRAKKLLEERHKSLTEQAQRDERDAEQNRAKADDIKDLLNGLDLDGFVPEGWLSPEQVAALKADYAATFAKMNEETAKANAMLKAQHEKHETVLADLMQQKNEAIRMRDAAFDTASQKHQEALDELRERIGEMQTDLIAYEHDMKEVEAARDEAKAKIDTMEKTYKQAGDILRAAADAAHEKAKAYEHDFKEIHKLLQNVDLHCAPTSEAVLDTLRRALYQAPTGSPAARGRDERTESKRGRFRAAVVSAIAELLR